MAIRKCEMCKRNEATFALQYIGDDTPQYYFLGHHIRGFRVQRICQPCADVVTDQYIRSLTQGQEVAQ